MAWGKKWYTGKFAAPTKDPDAACFNREDKTYHIIYEDGDEEDLNLLELDAQRPAWELAPFMKEWMPH